MVTSLAFFVFISLLTGQKITQDESMREQGLKITGVR